MLGLSILLRQQLHRDLHALHGPLGRRHGREKHRALHHVHHDRRSRLSMLISVDSLLLRARKFAAYLCHLRGLHGHRLHVHHGRHQILHGRLCRLLLV